MRAKKKKSESAANGQAKGDENKKDPRIKSYDYSSWEKFDVVYITYPYIINMNEIYFFALKNN